MGDSKMYITELIELKDHLSQLDENIIDKINDHIFDEFDGNNSRILADRMKNIFFTWLNDNVEDIKFK